MLLVFAVVTKILVLCGTFESWWVLCEVVLTLQSRVLIGSVTHVGAGWVKAWRCLCSHMVHDNPAHSSSETQLMSQAGGMWKLGPSEPCFAQQRHSIWHSVREHVVVIMREFELPEEQKGGRSQRKICSAVFVVGIIACCAQAVQD